MASYVARRFVPAFLMAFVLMGSHFSAAIGMRGMKQAIPEDETQSNSRATDSDLPGTSQSVNGSPAPEGGAGPNGDSRDHYETDPIPSAELPGYSGPSPGHSGPPPGYGSHAFPPDVYYYNRNNDRTPWDRVLDLVKTAADEVGLYKAVTFLQDVLPVAPGILDDAPVAVLYLQRMFKYGYAEGGSESKVTSALHRILQGTISTIVATDTGSDVAERVLLEQGIDLTAVASTESWGELVPLLNTGIWAALDEDYSAATVALTTLNILKGMVVYTLSPYARLSLQQVAADLVTAALSLATNVVDNADVLQSQADRELTMTYEEWYAFQNLQRNLDTVRQALEKLDNSLVRPNAPDSPGYGGPDAPLLPVY